MLTEDPVSQHIFTARDGMQTVLIVRWRKPLRITKRTALRFLYAFNRPLLCVDLCDASRPVNLQWLPMPEHLQALPGTAGVQQFQPKSQRAGPMLCGLKAPKLSTVAPLKGYPQRTARANRQVRIDGLPLLWQCGTEKQRVGQQLRLKTQHIGKRCTSEFSDTP
ncbi:MAG: hypothetical protein BWZ07_02645 [Alphaproteobacteria bacterium ADurb.BinA280]|nr:MAG: hypothetical protein BWZ07_02645 [Alphaproteobacteria bacterium ADurb.BinA280]